jgi:hypothetical protein
MNSHAPGAYQYEMVCEPTPIACRERYSASFRRAVSGKYKPSIQILVGVFAGLERCVRRIPNGLVSFNRPPWKLALPSRWGVKSDSRERLWPNAIASRDAACQAKASC